MKRKFFTASLAAVMMVASFTSCAASNNETIVTEVEGTEQVETANVTEESSVETTIEETETSETSEETTVETTETAETTIVVDPAGVFEPFVIPAEDTTYIDKLIDAGIAPEYYRGTYIAFDDNIGEYGDIIIYFVNNNPDQSAQIYDFAEMGDDFSDIENEEFFSIWLESYYRYFDYYENYDGRQAIDLNEDGEISIGEMNICAFFTCGLEWRGLVPDEFV